MDYEENYSDEEDFEDGEQETTQPTFKSSYVIVAIDTHSSMFQHDKNRKLPFRNSLESCLRILDSLILVKDSKRWNPFAVLLARDDPVLVNFGDNIIESVKLLQSKLKLSDQELENEYKRRNDFSLAEFLLQCKKAFYDIKAAFYKRHLIFITNNDNPVQNNQSKFAAINEVASFEASEIKFEVIPLNENFDFNLLYNELLAQMVGESKEVICTDVDGLQQKLASALLPKYYRRKVNFYPFQGDTERYLTCYGFSVFKSVSLLNTKLTKEGKEVMPKPPIPSEDLPTFTLQKLAKTPTGVKFDVIEKNNFLNASFPRGYTLICIGKAMVEPIHNIFKNHVLQQHVKEETDYFKKFWNYCAANEKVLICIVKYKQPGKIKYCQLSPIIFGGVPSFLCKEIPYGDYMAISTQEHPVKVEIDQEKLAVVRKLVDKLSIEFHPDMIPNPKYRKKMEYVKAKLLDVPYEDNVEVFDKNSINERVREEVEEIKNVFSIVPDTNTNKKRKRPENSTKAAPRRKKN